MEDEVYNYGSFKQSKMFAKGVTCSDCHDPHSAKLRLPGDGVCLQCHAADKYAVASHSRHEGVDPPVGCPACHMPTRTYMVVDPRHDHSFRIPRPDLSVRLGTPNACNACHADKTAQWAADAIAELAWAGPQGLPALRPGLPRRLDRASRRRGALLAAVASDSQTPGFARAGALAELAPFLSRPMSASRSRASPIPIRWCGSARSTCWSSARRKQIWPLAAPLLSDPVRGVRIRAADLLAAVPAASQPAADREAFSRAAEEFVAAQKLNADRPEARLTLGSFYARTARRRRPRREYKAALKIAPQFAPAAVNLADLYRQTGRDADGEAVLRAALAASPKDAGLHYALGLAPDPSEATRRRACRIAAGGGASRPRMRTTSMSTPSRSIRPAAATKRERPSPTRLANIPTIARS